MSIQLIALKTLETLCEQFETMGIDVDESSESISIHTYQGLYLINYHGTMQQIWLSSPITGAHHFQWNDNTWVSTRSSTSLQEIIDQEISGFSQ
jgi:iron donor protein CyaY